MTDPWIGLQASTERLEILSVQCREQFGNVSGHDQGFDGLRISVWKLNRMMECVRNIGRGDADSMREHHPEDGGLRLKGCILKWRPTMTTSNDKLRVLQQQPPNHLNVASFYCTFECEQLFPSAHLSGHR